MWSPCTIPRTKDTTNLLSEERMRAMKKGAYIVNAARGGWSTRTRCATAGRRHLAGAALDTFATEPLPEPILAACASKLIL